MMALGDLVARHGGACSPALQGRGPLIGGIRLDSRAVEPGDLFAALPGSVADGGRYVAQALQRGAVAVLSPALLAPGGVPNWIHHQARRVAGEAAADLHGNPSHGMFVVAVTGTNGKTTTAHLTGQLLEHCGRRPAVLGTAGNRLADGVWTSASHTTPDAPALQALLARHRELSGDCVALELSSHALDQERHAGLEIDVAQFTNLTQDHLDYHGDMARYRAAKQQLFAGLRAGAHAVVNADDPAGAAMADAARAAGARIHTYSTRSRADLWASEIEMDSQGTRFWIQGMGILRTRVRLPLWGHFNVANALAALAAVLLSDASPSHALDGLASVSPAPGRLERVDDAGLGVTLLVDYAHSEDALRQVLTTLREHLGGHGRLICVFGCGGDRDAGKRPRMGAAVAELADVAVVTSDNPRSEEPRAIAEAIVSGMRGGAVREVELDRRAAIARALELARPGDLVVVAGKGHETTQAIGTLVQAFDDRAVLSQLARERAPQEVNTMLVQEIIDATGAMLVRGDPRALVHGVSTDSRALKPRELFLALSGPNFDGNQFAEAAGRAGAGALLLQNKPGQPLPQFAGELPVALHEAPRRALADLASWHRSRIQAQVIGITGSCGKTTTKELLAQLLAPHGNTVASPNSFNNDIGVPHTILMADQDTRMLIVEIGTNGPGEIAALARIARPTVGVITNIGNAHLEGLGSIEGVLREKSELFAALPRNGTAVLNLDCRFARELRAATSAKVISFSVEGGSDGDRDSVGDFNAEQPWFHAAGTTFRLRGHEITSPLLGVHNVSNLLAAIAAAEAIGISLEQLLPSISRLKGGRRRMERLELQGVLVFDDTYNANPESARAGLRVLAGLHGHRRRVWILGDMLELGPRAPELHHAMGKAAAESLVDQLLLVGELTRATAAGALEAGMAPGRVHHLGGRDEALASIGQWIEHGDVVLVKGSNAMGMDRVVRRLGEVFGPAAH